MDKANIAYTHGGILFIHEQCYANCRKVDACRNIELSEICQKQAEKYLIPLICFAYVLYKCINHTYAHTCVGRSPTVWGEEDPEGWRRGRKGRVWE